MKRIRNNFNKHERNLRFTYREFIDSEWWTKQKEDWYSRHNKICAICKTYKNIHLHHKKYPKNGKYLNLSDNAFVAFCGNCHYSYHRKYGVHGYMQTTTNRFLRKGRLLDNEVEKYEREFEQYNEFFRSI